MNKKTLLIFIILIAVLHISWAEEQMVFFMNPKIPNANVVISRRADYGNYDYYFEIANEYGATIFERQPVDKKVQVREVRERFITTLDDLELISYGTLELSWNGKANDGEILADGIYYVTIYEINRKNKSHMLDYIYTVTLDTVQVEFMIEFHSTIVNKNNNERLICSVFPETVKANYWKINIIDENGYSVFERRKNAGFNNEIEFSEFTWADFASLDERTYKYSVRIEAGDCAENVNYHTKEFEVSSLNVGSSDPPSGSNSPSNPNQFGNEFKEYIELLKKTIKYPDEKRLLKLDTPQIVSLYIPFNEKFYIESIEIDINSNLQPSEKYPFIAISRQNNGASFDFHSVPIEIGKYDSSLICVFDNGYRYIHELGKLYFTEFVPYIDIFSLYNKASKAFDFNLQSFTTDDSIHIESMNVTVNNSQNKMLKQISPANIYQFEWNGMDNRNSFILESAENYIFDFIFRNSEGETYTITKNVQSGLVTLENRNKETRIIIKSILYPAYENNIFYSGNDRADNIRTIQRIATLLKEILPEYKYVVVRGHANYTTYNNPAKMRIEKNELVLFAIRAYQPIITAYAFN
ncbi:hypothetical protein AGMMS50268_14720 [Spirochaetia bacterium]|nr:hypothetical protein AGMMS50268_14720 [Spirochaetia bacterium]